MTNVRCTRSLGVVGQTLIVTLVGSLSACDTSYGVMRSTPIQVDPTPECVERVLRSTPGIASVEYKHSSGGRDLTLSGIKPPILVESFFYKGPDNVRGVLQYTKDYDGTMEFSQSLTEINVIPPQEYITATRPVMYKVELDLERECGLVGLTSRIKEWCNKEDCPPLN